jgi:branched-chain amino acid transport system ATP-binding protein
MLEIENVHTYYGRSHILQGVSFSIYSKEIVCLLGRNGVGKTTTLKSIIGLTPPRRGAIRFENREINGLKTHQIARRGISYVPEDRRIFSSLTVEQNLLLGAKNQPVANPEAKIKNMEKIYNYFPILKIRKKQSGGTLSGGEQQMLTIGRGLMGNPKLMLLDEPFEGLAPLIVKELARIISLLSREEGLTILLVEQNARMALRMAGRGYVLEKGLITFEGTSGVMRESEEVKRRCGI